MLQANSRISGAGLLLSRGIATRSGRGPGELSIAAASENSLLHLLKLGRPVPVCDSLCAGCGMTSAHPPNSQERRNMERSEM